MPANKSKKKTISNLKKGCPQEPPAQERFYSIPTALTPSTRAVSEATISEHTVSPPDALDRVSITSPPPVMDDLDEIEALMAGIGGEENHKTKNQKKKDKKKKLLQIVADLKSDQPSAIGLISGGFLTKTSSDGSGLSSVIPSQCETPNSVVGKKKKLPQEKVNFEENFKPNRGNLSEKEAKLADEVKALFKEEFQETFEEQISKKGGYRLTVMTNVEGEMLSFIMYKIMPKRKCLSVAHVAVPKHRRRLGYGKMMMRYILKYAKNQSRNLVQYVGLSSLPASIKFYQSLGFKKNAEITKPKNKQFESILENVPSSNFDVVVPHHCSFWQQWRMDLLTQKYPSAIFLSACDAFSDCGDESLATPLTSFCGSYYDEHLSTPLRSWQSVGSASVGSSMPSSSPRSTLINDDDEEEIEFIEGQVYMTYPIKGR